MSALLLALACAQPAAAEAFATWPPHLSRFGSTGGGGVIIDEYNPVVIGDRCVTRFTATLPDGQVFANYALFDAVPTAGGILCTNGRWGAVDGSATGTTPYRLFIHEGMIRRAPD
jgi:hypothetical protein